jgi:hypothetical protein
VSQSRLTSSSKVGNSAGFFAKTFLPIAGWASNVCMLAGAVSNENA